MRNSNWNTNETQTEHKRDTKPPQTISINLSYANKTMLLFYVLMVIFTYKHIKTEGKVKWMILNGLLPEYKNFLS